MFSILLVEDSDEDYLAFTRALRDTAVTVSLPRCTRGEEALDYLYGRGRFADPARAPRPTLVLLDLNLPGMDGRELLTIIKGDEHLKSIPVVIVTMLVGVAAAAALWFRRYTWARVLIVAEVAFLLLSWGVSQYPYIIPPDVTAANASSPLETQQFLLVGIIIALIIVLPSLWYLFYVFKLKKVESGAGDVAQKPAE